MWISYAEFELSEGREVSKQPGGSIEKIVIKARDENTKDKDANDTTDAES